jgi:methyl-accepting chemotaxis protein
MSINDWKISTKLVVAFGAVVTSIAALGAVVYVQLADLGRSAGIVLAGEEALNIVETIARSVSAQESSARAYLITQNDTYVELIEEKKESFNAQIEMLKEQLTGVEGAGDLVASLETSAAGYVANVIDKEISLASDPGTLPQAVALMKSEDAAALLETATTAIDDIRSDVKDRLDTAHDEQTEVEAFTTVAAFAGVLIAAALAVLFGWWLSRNTSKPVKAMSDVMRKLANGDNSVDIPCAGRKDEMGDMADAVMTFKQNAIEKVALEDARAKETADDQTAIGALAEGLAALATGNLTHRIEVPFAQKSQQLKDDFNTAIHQMDEAMSIIASNASGIRSGAGEVSHAADDLSRRTEQQAANLEETAAALDEITATVRKTAQGAGSANTVVLNARTEAEQSGRVVKSAVEAMNQIEGSSRQIGQIIGVIDEIAFQTNLLALNAGVEADRAGDAGRGIAVDASEVRALAQRSADAAKEIKGLITASSSQVGSGVSLVGQTGEALQRIMAQVSQISGLVSEITASAQEQASGLNQVNAAVNQMDQVTQQNAAMVEQSTAASRSLAQESVELSRLVSRFNVTNKVVVPTAVKSEPVGRKRGPVTQMKATSQVKTLAVAEDASWEEF